jgi:MFS family permease
MKTDSSIRIHFLTLLIGFSQIYAWATTYYIPAALVQVIAPEIHQSTLVIMGGFSWALFIGGICAPKIGAWIDLEGGRRPLALGSLLMGTGLLVLSQTHRLFIWYFGWTLVGLGMALGLFNAVFASIGRLLGQDAKKIIVRVTLISGFATLFWPLTTTLIQSIGWRNMMILYAIPHLMIWAPLFIYNFPTLVPEHSKLDINDQLVIPEKVKLVFLLLAAYAILRAIVGTTISVDILSMFQGIGLSVSVAAITASLIGPSQIVGRIIEMYFGQHFNPLHSSIFWTAVLPISIILLVIVGSSSASFFAIAYGMSNGVLTITMGVLPMVLFGSKGYATLLGKLALPVLIAQAATPILVAPILEHWSSIDLFIIAAVLGVLSFLCLTVLTFITKKS